MKNYIKNILIKIKNKLEKYDNVDSQFWNDLYKGDVLENV